MFVVLYAVLGVVAFLLMRHFARKELAPVTAETEEETPALQFTY